MINMPCKLSKEICDAKFQKKCAMQNFINIIVMRALLFPMYKLLFNSVIAVYLPAS